MTTSLSYTCVNTSPHFSLKAPCNLGHNIYLPLVKRWVSDMISDESSSHVDQMPDFLNYMKSRVPDEHRRVNPSGKITDYSKKVEVLDATTD